MRRSLPFLIIAGVLLVALGAGWVLYHERMEPEPTPKPSPAAVTPSPLPATTASIAPAASSTPEASTTVTPATTAPASAGPTFSYGQSGAEPMHIRGDPGAPVVLEEFGDFECLPCSNLFPILLKLEQDYAKKLVVVFREHPLRKHHFALDAARAAEAAGLQGKFWEMHDTLYRNRATWVPAAYIRPFMNDYAAELQLDVDRFKTDMDGKQVADRILADQDRGDSLEIDRTPVLFLNGEKVAVTDFNENSLRALIDKALATKSP